MSGAGGGKRPSGGDSPPGPPEKKSKKEEKTTTTLIEPIRIAGVSSTVSHWLSPVAVIVCNGFDLLLNRIPSLGGNKMCAGGNGHEGHPVQKQEAV